MPRGEDWTQWGSRQPAGLTAILVLAVALASFLPALLVQPRRAPVLSRGLASLISEGSVPAPSGFSPGRDGRSVGGHREPGAEEVEVGPASLSCPGGSGRRAGTPDVPVGARPHPHTGSTPKWRSAALHWGQALGAAPLTGIPSLQSHLPPAPQKPGSRDLPCALQAAAPLGTRSVSGSTGRLVCPCPLGPGWPSAFWRGRQVLRALATRREVLLSVPGGPCRAGWLSAPGVGTWLAGPGCGALTACPVLRAGRLPWTALW